MRAIMRTLYVQIHPQRSPGIDMGAVTALFEAIAARTDLVRSHSFDYGREKGGLYNYALDTTRAGELWQLVRDGIFRAPDHREHLATSAMAICSSKAGWSDYSLLHHWDPDLPVVPEP